MRVSEYMTQPVVSVQPQTEFHLAFDIMRARNIHHLPVVDGEQLVGIVAERDLLLAAAHFGSAEVPVVEIMHSPVVCVSERASLKAVARMLVVNHIGSLPVLNAKKALIGMITESDVFKIMAGMAHPRKPSKTKPRAATKTGARKQPAAKRAAKTRPSTGKKPAR